MRSRWVGCRWPTGGCGRRRQEDAREGRQIVEELKQANADIAAEKIRRKDIKKEARKQKKGQLSVTHAKSTESMQLQSVVRERKENGAEQPVTEQNKKRKKQTTSKEKGETTSWVHRVE